MSETCTLINGSFEQQLNVADRGLAYGDGLFETIRVKNNTPEYWGLHLDRLIDGCQRLNLNIDGTQLRSDLYNDVTKLLSKNKEHYATLKIVITRGVGPRGYGYPAGITATRICSLSNSIQADPALKVQGARLYRCQLTLGDQPALAGIKHLNRLEQVLARSEWGSDYYEGLLVNAHGHVIEGVMSNVFMIKNDQLITPELNTAGVAGILRHRVMAWAKRHKYPLTVERFSLESFKAADHLFVCNSLSGVVPIRFFDEKTYQIWPLHQTMNTWLVEDAQASLTEFATGSK